MAGDTFGQYVDIKIEDGLKYDLRIENARLDSGQFYRQGDRSDIMTADDVDDMIIRHNGGIRDVCSCGETDSMSGTQGTLDLYDDVKDTRICTLAWSAPMQSGRRNAFKKLNHNPQYTVDIGDWRESGTMGMVPVTVKDRS
ncbi:aegerolysin type hemolysin [Aspergillus coremiiformis]|uniref:Aegerolysin type hemolysin n=1 Tax=Aspergillus coremiiformis TaxID=138285 RepID=A0A5N6YUL6_9EURO|nr:aegerolysin type hemolysin [Aspergillus coremiiformis]